MIEPVLLGAVIAAHGIQGEVRVKTFTLAPQNLGAYGPLSTEGGRVLKVLNLRLAKPGEAIVTFAGITGRDEAERLKGERLYVSRARLPLLDAGEFYLADLVGLAAEDREGKSLGKVRAIHNFGAGDIVEIEFHGGGIEFVPMTDACVPLVDVTGGRMVIEMPREAGKP